MVERCKRDKAATVIRDLIDGKITNEEFMRQFPRSGDDPALPAILTAAWMQFSDRRIHRLTGRDTPTPDSRAVLERCWLFLATELEFQWPPRKSRVGKGLLQLIGFGGPFLASDQVYRSHGDFEVWPFLKTSDYEAHKRNLAES